MKRFTFLFVVILSLPYFLVAQEEPEKLKLNFSGYVGYDLFFDTYESVTSRDGAVYLYPVAENIDVNGDDFIYIYKNPIADLESPRHLFSGCDFETAKEAYEYAKINIDISIVKSPDGY